MKKSKREERKGTQKTDELKLRATGQKTDNPEQGKTKQRKPSFLDWQDCVGTHFIGRR